MTDNTQAAATITSYDALVERFCEVVDGAPYFKQISEENEKYARLSIITDVARLTWPEATSSDDDASILDEETYAIPIDLLFLSDAALKEWKNNQRIIHESKRQERMAVAAAAAAQTASEQERALFARLKAKYEPSEGGGD